MNNIQLSIDESTFKRLHELAAERGIPLEKEASLLLDGAVRRAKQLHAFSLETDAFAASLPLQITDSVDLIREDRDNR